MNKPDLLTPIRVRAMLAQDGPALRELFLASRRRTFTWLPTEAFQLADFDTQTRGESLLLATEGTARIVGFISVWEPESFIHHLHVAPERQRNGIGALLLGALPNWPQHPYRLKCLQRNAQALAFYARNGFTRIGSGVAEDGEYVLLESRHAGNALRRDS